MLKILTTGAILLAAAPASAACFGSNTFSTCTDDSGNSYTTNRYGNMSTTNGTSASGNTWSQTTTDLGSTSITNGVAADGNSWNMTQQNLGGGYRSYNGTDSDGNSFSGTCGPYGCN
ncbi:hypothetical protein VQ045_20580 [Aurantimonas sp. E1-2-R+4]|uniref:hypothetical protein n=1 Tax=Aurantimonas sp. E1-2-R+4 TaxID=3113714 RepID=UPI002F953CC7